jgi:hypothetical protein
MGIDAPTKLYKEDDLNSEMIGKGHDFLTESCVRCLHHVVAARCQLSSNKYNSPNAHSCYQWIDQTLPKPKPLQHCQLPSAVHLPKQHHQRQPPTCAPVFGVSSSAKPTTVG